MAASGSANPARKRLYLLAGFLFFWCAAIGFRLVQLQVFQYGEFVHRAERQQQRSIDVAPRRGVIYDRNGHELAMSVNVDSIFAVPSEVPDQATTARLLARILGTDTNEILARLQSSRAFCWIARKVDADTSNRIRALNLRGIYFQKESKRFYPKRELAAQVLGFVGTDDEGLAGIERSYDESLRGKPGQMLISMDAKRRWFGRVEKQPEAGDSVVLTLDEKIQYIAERELETAMQQTHAAAATVIVENPHTGEILALANRPTFNPNLHPRNLEELNDRAVSDIYEPGSTFKIVTLAAALEEKLTRPDEVFDCQNGSIVVNGLRIRDHKAFGNLTVAEILMHSSDVGAIKVALRLGDQRFDKYIRAFGFGSQTGIELPGETRGLTKPASRWSKVSIGAISMGQEIGVSAIQLAAMISTIANDGLWTAPRIVSGEASPGAPLQNVSFHPGRQRRVISNGTAAEMKAMLEGVVLTGTGRKALLDGYRVGGKTGTAQKTDPATGAYSKSKYVASFAGFAPLNDPAVTVAVILDSPVGPHEGGQVAAPVFQRIMTQVLAYLNVPQDLPPALEAKRHALLAKSHVTDAEVSESAPDRVETGGDLVAEATPPPAAPPKGTAAPSLQPVAAPEQPKKRDAAEPPQPQAEPKPAPNGTVVVDVGGGVVVPSLIGMPLRSAIVTAEAAGLEIDAVGSGIAQQQSPAPGSRLPSGARIAVTFGR